MHHRSMAFLHVARVFVVFGVLVGSVGCVKVAPYERGTLAHPTMTPDDVAIGIDEHVRTVSEGASGGLAGAGGGCGCN